MMSSSHVNGGGGTRTRDPRVLRTPSRISANATNANDERNAHHLAEFNHATPFSSVESLDSTVSGRNLLEADSRVKIHIVRVIVIGAAAEFQAVAMEKAALLKSLAREEVFPADSEE